MTGHAEPDWQRLYPKLLQQAYRLTGSYASAQDVVQDAITGMLARPAPPAIPAAYLSRAVTNRVIDATRSQQALTRVLPRLAAPAPAGPDADTVLTVRCALIRLPPAQRRALILTYWAGYDEAATAAAMHLARGTVKSHLHKGRRRLAALIGEAA